MAAAEDPQHASGAGISAGLADRVVATRAIQAAVQGREAEVLDALGIPWREGRPHISCPYPDHADGDPSWRWDARKARACAPAAGRTACSTSS